MSTNYYGLPTRDAALIAPLIEGRAEGFSIDAAAIRAVLCESIDFAVEEGAGIHDTLVWRGPGGHVFVDVGDDHVLVTMGGERVEDDQADVVVDTLEVLRDHDLHVYNPQRGEFF